LHFADKDSAYRNADDRIKTFMRNVPVAWDDTKFIQGEPGKETVLARRKGTVWYIAGATGESTPKTITLNMGFLKSSNYTMRLFSDGTSAREIKITESDLDKNGTMVNLLPDGGFVLVLTPKATK